MSFLQGLIQGVAERTQQRRDDQLKEELLKAQLQEHKAKQKSQQLLAQAMMGQVTPEMLQQALQPQPEAPPTVPFQRMGEDLSSLASGAKNLFSSLTGIGASPAPTETAQPAPATPPLQQQMTTPSTPAPTAAVPMDQNKMVAALLMNAGQGDAAVKLMTTPPPLTTEQIVARRDALNAPPPGGASPASSTFGTKRLQGWSMDTKGNVTLRSDEKALSEWENVAQSLMGEGGLSANEASLVGQAYQRSPMEAAALLKRMRPDSPLVARLYDAVAEMNQAQVAQRGKEAYATGAGGEAGRQSQALPDEGTLLERTVLDPTTNTPILETYYSKSGRVQNRQPAIPTGQTRGQRPLTTNTGSEIIYTDPVTMRELKRIPIERILPANMGDKLTGLQGVLSEAEMLGQIYQKVGKDFTGPIRGRLGGLTEATVGASEAEAQFRRIHQEMSQSLLYARSGAQINEQEYQRLKNALPNPEDANFETKLLDFQRQLGNVYKLKVQGFSDLGYHIPPEFENFSPEGFLQEQGQQPNVLPAPQQAPQPSSSTPPASNAPAWERVQDPQTGKWVVRQKVGP